MSKAEKRHELQQNELADWLGEQIEVAKPHLPMIILGSVLAVALVGLMIFWINAGTTAGADVWSEYFAAFGEPEPAAALEQVATKHPNSPVAYWAWQSLGDHHLSLGQMELFSNRELAKASLEKAEAAYKKAEGTHDSMLKNRARLGLAKVYVSLDKPEEAAKIYKLIADADRNRVLGKSAELSEKQVQAKREVELLAWFAKQSPPRPGGMPDDLPARPDLSIPDTGLDLDKIDLTKPPDGPTEFPAPADPAKPADPTPAVDPAKPADSAKPTEDKPTEEKPAEEKSAAADKPAADEPAEAKPAETKP
ncbi:MAG: hypothetical protein SFU86_15660 [Pirellulaceae bacterium]|nr:hypothetical protein [Pirellulaceae bacterium]